MNSYSQPQVANELTPRKDLAPRDRESAVDLALAIRECVAMTNAVIQELVEGPSVEKSNGTVPIPLGLMDTLEQALNAAQLLRERVADVKQRIGRL